MQINENVLRKLVESADKGAIARIMYEIATEYYGDYILAILADGKVLREKDVKQDDLIKVIQKEHPEYKDISITEYKIDNIQRRVLIYYICNDTNSYAEYV